METTKIIANGFADMVRGDEAEQFASKVNLRAAVWFGFGYHRAIQDGTENPYTKLLDAECLRRYPGDANKSKRSRIKSDAKALGSKFGTQFKDELVSQWETPGHMIQGCFLSMMASGATSRVKMADWLKHGDPDYTAKEKERKAQEKTDATRYALEAQIDDIDGATLFGLDIDATPEPRSNLEPAAPATPVDPLAFVADMNDEDLAALAKAVSAEKARRTRAAKAA